MPVQNTFCVQCIYINTNSHVLIPSFPGLRARLCSDGGPTALRRRTRRLSCESLCRRSSRSPTCSALYIHTNSHVLIPPFPGLHANLCSDGGLTAVRRRSDGAPTYFSQSGMPLSATIRVRAFANVMVLMLYIQRTTETQSPSHIQNTKDTPTITSLQLRHPADQMEARALYRALLAIRRP